jgi:hypothetical protein
MVKAQMEKDTKEVTRIDGGRLFQRETVTRLVTGSLEGGTNCMSMDPYFVNS